MSAMTNVTTVTPIQATAEELEIQALQALGLYVEESEEIEAKAAQLKTHEGSLFVTAEGRTHATFQPINMNLLTPIKDKKGQLSAYRVKVHAMAENGQPIKVPVEYTRRDAEGKELGTVRGYLVMNSANMYLTLKPRTTAKK